MKKHTPTSAAYEALPTTNDQKHIAPLAQQIIDVIQPYAKANGLTLQGVMSSIGTASGALLARAYRNSNAKLAAPLTGAMHLLTVVVLYAMVFKPGGGA